MKKDIFELKAKYLHALTEENVNTPREKIVETAINNYNSGLLKLDLNYNIAAIIRKLVPGGIDLQLNVSYDKMSTEGKLVSRGFDCSVNVNFFIDHLDFYPELKIFGVSGNEINVLIDDVIAEAIIKGIDSFINELMGKMRK